MRQRPLRIFLLLLAAVWYGAVLPGHQRGVVQLPGSGSSSASGDACCEPGKPHRPGKPAAPARSPVTCAVCQYMATLSVAAPPDLGIAPLGLTDQPPAAPAPTIYDIRTFATYLGRAPPLA